MVMVQGDRTYGFKSFSEMVAVGGYTQRSSYRIDMQRVDFIVDSWNRINRPPPPPPPPI